ncbi:dicarboxylate/amino acid:cation symporter [Acholeplasma hippikon]|uniref:L-cystine uptake protein TcyP n=1 Tax=Acholeplasma hippikon TaxID=264636 RepID=A0A449BIW5_9MOLU|nr:dicarboxylate/amino acid:cation symporter [Acholeplasma hippikon]VEU82404.1 Glutamate-aspartate carrier protein [Acholeplasma hippikon]
MFENYKIDSVQKGLLYVVTILVIALLMFLSKKKVKFGFKVLTGMALGVLVGLIFGSTKTIVDSKEITIVETIRPIGQLYLKLIQMIVIPLVLTSVIKSFTSINDMTKLKRIGFKSLFWLLSTTAIATLIGFGFATLFGLGKGMPTEVPYTPREITMIEDVILGFFPNNIVQALTGTAVIPVVVFGLFVAIAILGESKKHPERVKPFLDFNESFNRIMIRITKMVMKLTPYAVFTFMAFAVARNEVSVLKDLLIYILVIYGAMTFHFIVVQMGLITTHKLSPKQFLKNFGEAMAVAFTTQSSYGTLPVTSRVLKEKAGITDTVVDFVAPIGANVGMNACGGIFPAVVAVMTANAYGIQFTFVQVLVLVLTTTIASIGIAGVPGIATIAATVTLSALGLPIEGIALVVAVDALVDMGRTMINVTGAGVVATIVAKSENEIDLSVYNNSKETEIHSEV